MVGSRGLCLLYMQIKIHGTGRPRIARFLASVYYTLSDRPNLHHVFPADFCDKHLTNGNRYSDSLLNIAYLTQMTNQRISNKNPLVYLQDYVGHRFDEIRKSHLLPNVLVELTENEELLDDSLDRFVEARLELVLQSIEKSLHGISFEVVDTRSESSEILA